MSMRNYWEIYKPQNWLTDWAPPKNINKKITTINGWNFIGQKHRDLIHFNDDISAEQNHASVALD